jgi:hypothetical protein
VLTGIYLDEPQVNSSSTNSASPSPSLPEEDRDAAGMEGTR